MEARTEASAELEISFDDVCLHAAFEARVRETPEATAVTCGDESLSYEALNRNANQLAHYLRELGVTPGTMIGLFVERTLDVATAIMGILKSGGAYVPLDPAYPEERLGNMIEDTASPVILTQSHLKNMLPDTGARVVCLDSDWPKVSEQSGENPPHTLGSEALAYVIFTSGSTGRPRGVCCNHRGVMNLLADCEERQPAGPGVVCRWRTTLNFHVSVYERSSPLVT